MEIDAPHTWNEQNIWESLLDKNLNFSIFDVELFEWWENIVGIRKDDYIEMNDAKRIVFYDDWGKYDMISYASERIINLENILKRPNIHPMQKKVAKILRDRLKAKINSKKYGAVGWSETLKAIKNGDIDPENLEGNE